MALWVLSTDVDAERVWVIYSIGMIRNFTVAFV